jgi:hypothetical protein
MAEETYIRREPGDLITAEDWNDLQTQIKEDISTQSREAAEQIKKVEEAENALKLEGSTLAEVTEEIVRRATEQLHHMRAYRMLFKRLELNVEKLIEHQLGDFPLIDIYQLDYFPVVACEDKECTYPLWTTFYLHETEEKKVRYTTSGDDKGSIDVQPRKSPYYRVLFKEMLQRYGVAFDQKQSLSDLETKFWGTFCSDPNDEFYDDQYCHSPWFDKCCREQWSIAKVFEKGHADDLWLQMRLRKTIHYDGSEANLPVVPPALQVTHYDFNTLGIKLLASPTYPGYDDFASATPGMQILNDQLGSSIVGNELNVMVLLKC